jgi:2-isopropylmalate synthase
MPNLHFKLGYEFKAAANLSRLVELAHTTDKFANLLPNPKAPYVGRSAFAHKGGVHANAAQKVSRSYEHIEPEKVGNRQRILLSDMAGASSVAMKAEDAGIDVDPKSPEMRAFLKKLKEREARGYEYENADASFKVLLSQHFHGLKDNFKLVSYRTISEVVRDKHENISEAVVKIRVVGDEEIKLSVAESAGPVGALDHAMRIAFGAHFPELRQVQLIDYKVRILQTGLGTDSIVQVLMLSGDENQSWWTCGADQNIIEASWQALRDSFRYKLLIG